MPFVDRVVADRLADEVVGDREDLEAVLGQHPPLARPRSRRRRAPCRPRSGHPSRRSPARRNPSPEASRHTSSNGRSAHWPVNNVIGRAMLVRSLDRCRRPRSIVFQAVAALRSPRRAPAARRRRVRERRARVGAGDDRLDEVAGLVGEGVLVAEQVTGRPPRADVRVVRLGHENAGEALLGGGPVASQNSSSLRRSRSKTSEPAEPLTSTRSAFLRPVANRVASKVATAPPDDPAHEQRRVVDRDRAGPPVAAAAGR